MTSMDNNWVIAVTDWLKHEYVIVTDNLLYKQTLYV